MNRKKRVLFILHCLQMGGSEVFTLNVINNIDKNNIDINVLLTTNVKQPLEDEVVKGGTKVYHIKEFNGTISKVIFFFRLIKFFKNNGPFDVMHTHNNFFNGIYALAALFAGIPIRIVHVHTTGSENNSNGIDYKIVRLLYYFIMRLFMKTSTYCLGCSEAANDYAYGKRWRKKKKYKVINNGIDLVKFNPNSTEKVLIHQQFYIPQNKINFVTVGRISDVKNPFFTVEVINELLKIRDDIHFTWIGTGPLEKQVKDNVKLYCIEDKFSFLGVRRDIEVIFSVMDFLLLPSKWEGLAITLIEAQASLIPCFISDTIPQEANLGLCTKLSLRDDAKIWAEKINNYINNKSYNNIINLDKLKKFDIREVVRELQSIYLSK